MKGIGRVSRGFALAAVLPSVGFGGDIGGGAATGMEPATAAADAYPIIRPPAMDYSRPSCIAQPNPPPGAILRQTRLRSATVVTADTVEAKINRQTTLDGDVAIARADQTITARRVVIDETRGELVIDDPVAYEDAEMRIAAARARARRDNGAGDFHRVAFQSKAPYARGTAATARIRDGGRVLFDDVRDTPCPPGDNAWRIAARRLELDRGRGRGEGRHVWLEVFGAPVVYTPYINFPIDDRRQSGLLAPTIGYSNRRGAELATPVYWNIAPDQDATIYPRLMSRRGLQLGGEYRYLNRRDSGEAHAEYLSDAVADSDRWAVHYQHRGRYGGWAFNSGLRRVSDERYFDDLSAATALASERHLQSHIAASRGGDNWRAQVSAQNYQTIDETIAAADRPYARVPTIRFNMNSDPFNGLFGDDLSGGRFTAAATVEFSRFDKADALTGQRADIYPHIRWRRRHPGYFIEPKFGVRHTAYAVKPVAEPEHTIKRTVPIFSIDGGLYFDRFIGAAGAAAPLQQTLEPRFYYLNVPRREQSRIPLFDTGGLLGRGAALFAENRFNGIDRIGDADRIDVGVASRFIDPADGAEKLTVVFGQTYYFRDRVVAIDPDSAADAAVSPITAAARYRPQNGFTSDLEWRWQPDTDETELAVWRMRYRPPGDKAKVINWAYRYNKGYLKQTDASLSWPLERARRWHIAGRWNYSLRHGQTLDALVGVEYESCCWRARLGYNRRVEDINESADAEMMLEIELKGLGDFGHEVDDFMRAAIPGYDR